MCDINRYDKWKKKSVMSADNWYGPNILGIRMKKVYFLFFTKPHGMEMEKKWKEEKLYFNAFNFFTVLLCSLKKLYILLQKEPFAFPRQTLHFTLLKNCSPEKKKKKHSCKGFSFPRETLHSLAKKLHSESLIILQNFCILWLQFFVPPTKNLIHQKKRQKWWWK